MKNILKFSFTILLILFSINISSADNKCEFKKISEADHIGLFENEYIGSTITSKKPYQNTNGYSFVTRNNGKYYVNINGKETELKYQNKMANVIVSNNFKSYAYTVRENNKFYIVKDGIKQPGLFDNIISKDIVYSPNSKSFTYVGNINVKNKYGRYDSKGIIIKDGEKYGEEYDSAFNPHYSSDSKSFSYLAFKNGNRIIIKDGKEISKNYKWVKYANYIGNKYIYIGSDYSNSNKNVFVENGIEKGDVNGYSIDEKSIKLSDNKENYSLIMRKGSNSIVIHNGKISEELGFIKEVFFINKGTEIVFISRKNGKDEIYRNFKKINQEKEENINYLQVSDDGENFGYLTYYEKQLYSSLKLGYIVINGKDKIESHDGIVYFEYQPNSNKISYTAFKKQGETTINHAYVVVHNGKEGKEYTYIEKDFYISKDGEKIVYLASNSNRNNKIYNKDGIEYPSNNFSKINLIYPNNIFSEKGGYGIIEGKNNKVFIKNSNNPEGKESFYIGECKGEYINTKNYNIKPKLKIKIDNLVSRSSKIKLSKLSEQLSKIDLNSKKYSKHKDLIEYLKESINKKLDHDK